MGTVWLGSTFGTVTSWSDTQILAGDGTFGCDPHDGNRKGSRGGRSHTTITPPQQHAGPAPPRERVLLNRVLTWPPRRQPPARRSCRQPRAVRRSGKPFR